MKRIDKGWERDKMAAIQGSHLGLFHRDCCSVVNNNTVSRQ